MDGVDGVFREEEDGTMRGLVLALLAVGGCSSSVTAPAVSGPSAEVQELALQVAWDDVYGMNGKPRPTISWVAPCPVPESPDVTTPGPVCWGGTAHPDGRVDLPWRGSFSGSIDFVWTLYSVREWTLYGSGDEHQKRYYGADQKLMPNALAMLRAAGL